MAVKREVIENYILQIGRQSQSILNEVIVIDARLGPRGQVTKGHKSHLATSLANIGLLISTSQVWYADGQVKDPHRNHIVSICENLKTDLQDI